MQYKKTEDNAWSDSCELYILIEFLSKKRVMMILFMIADGEDRFSGLQRKLPKINSKILMERLDELCECGYVAKNIISEKPRRIRYELLEKGMRVVECLQELSK